MSKSKKYKTHFMEDQRSIGKGIRKKMPPPQKVINPKDLQKQRRWDWRDELDKDENDEQ